MRAHKCKYKHTRRHVQCAQLYKHCGIIQNSNIYCIICAFFISSDECFFFIIRQAKLWQVLSGLAMMGALYNFILHDEKCVQTFERSTNVCVLTGFRFASLSLFLDPFLNAHAHTMNCFPLHYSKA